MADIGPVVPDRPLRPWRSETDIDYIYSGSFVDVDLSDDQIYANIEVSATSEPSATAPICDTEQ